MRDFSKFDTGPKLTMQQEAYIEGCKALDEPPELDKSSIIFIKSVINRHGWVRSRLRSEALSKARVSRGNYQCKACGNLFKAGEVEVDHRYGKHQPDKSNTLEDYLRRSFPPLDYLAVLCKNCHKCKSAATVR